MGVERTPQGRKVEELQAHKGHDGRDGNHGPESPGTTGLLVPTEGEPNPQTILNHAHDDVGGHVVGVVPMDTLEVADVEGVQEAAEEGPGAEDGAAAGGRPVEAEEADRRVVEAVEDAGAGGEVVELLGGGEVAGVKDGREGPRGDADGGESTVPRQQGVRCGDVGEELVDAAVVRPEVTQGEDDRSGLLHAEEAVEWPFSVELYNGLPGRYAAVSDDVLACVVAFGGTCPEEETAVEGCNVLGVLAW